MKILLIMKRYNFSKIYFLSELNHKTYVNIIRFLTEEILNLNFKNLLNI